MPSSFETRILIGWSFTVPQGLNCVRVLLLHNPRAGDEDHPPDELIDLLEARIL
jgi:hypothetical protein